MTPTKTPADVARRKFPLPYLNKSQREVFEQVASGNYALEGFSHRRAAIQHLLALGYIRQCGRKELCNDRFGIVFVTEYEVPLPEHIAWCEWRSSFSDEVLLQREDCI